jgi:glutathione S-transferase
LPLASRKSAKPGRRSSTETASKQSNKGAHLLTLYHHNLSVCSQKIRLQLEEKKIPWRGHFVDLLRGDHLTPQFLRLNPRALVPALVHDDVVVIESTVILEYIEDVFPVPSLRPSAPALRAQMRVLTKLPDDGLHAACGTISFAAAFARQLAEGMDPDELERRLAKMPDPERADRQRTLINEGFGAPFLRQAVGVYERAFDEMNTALGKSGGPYLLGAQFTLADLALVPYVERLRRLGLGGLWEMARPYVTRWFAVVRERPSFKAAFDAYAPKGYDDFVREKGIDLWPSVAPLLQKAV